MPPSAPKTLIAYRRLGETRVGLRLGDKIIDLRIERDHGPSAARVGEVRAGRVLSLDQNIGAVFVDVGTSRPGFLPLSKIVAELKLHEGQVLPVQVSQPETASKGPGLSWDIRLDGHAVTLLPHRPEIMVARSIGGPARRKSLREALIAALPEGMGGLVSRSAEPEGVLQEITSLVGLWAQAKAKSGPILYSPPADWHELARTAGAFRGERVDPPAGLQPGSLAEDDRSLLDDAVAEAHERTIVLADGKARLVIDQTEALVAIDVDGSLPLIDLAKIALAETPRQIRLRGLSGLILIDPPRMKQSSLEPLIETLQAELEGDTAVTNVLGLTRGGLIEITRERNRPSLATLLNQDPVLTRLLDSLWEAVQTALSQKQGRATVTLDKACLEALRARSHLLDEAQQVFGVPIVVGGPEEG